MGRILAIDYGKKRTGIAVTDPMRIIASPLETVSTDKLFDFLSQYLSKEAVDVFVIGMPMNLQNTDTHITQEVRELLPKLEEKFPGIEIKSIDERFTSKMAMDAMISGGMKKKDRAKKENVDKISAAIILQSYLTQIS